MTKINTHFETLPDELTEDEKINLGNKLANLQVKIDQVEEEKKSTVKDYNDQISDLSDEALRIAKQIKSGMTERSLEVFWQLNDPEAGVKTLYKYFTGEKIRTVPMDLFDKPGEFPDLDKEPQEPKQLTEGGLFDMPPIPEPKQLIEHVTEASYEIVDENEIFHFNGTPEEFEKEMNTIPGLPDPINVNDTCNFHKPIGETKPFPILPNICKGCSKEIYFLKSAKGKLVPVDAETVNEVERLNLDKALYDSKRHTSHFTTCPQAASFTKKRGRPKKDAT